MALGLFTATLLVADRRPVPPEHPRLLGSRAELQALAKHRPTEYQRTVAVARQAVSDDHAAIVSQALVAAIEGDGDLARQARQRALKFVDGPIRAGHVTAVLRRGGAAL